MRTKFSVSILPTFLRAHRQGWQTRSSPTGPAEVECTRHGQESIGTPIKPSSPPHWAKTCTWETHLTTNYFFGENPIVISGFYGETIFKTHPLVAVHYFIKNKQTNMHDDTLRTCVLWCVVSKGQPIDCVHVSMGKYLQSLGNYLLRTHH